MLDDIARRVRDGGRIDRAEATILWSEASDELLSELATAVRDRKNPPGEATYLIMAIVNTTNVCVAKCDYCAFYTLPGKAGAYLLSFEEVCGRIDALRGYGGTLVAFNGGFHPNLRLPFFADLFGKLRQRYGEELAFFEMTVAEFMFYCKVSKLSYDEGARMLAAKGTRWVTGGGAEVLDDEFRRRHSPLKYKVEDYYAAQKAIVDAGMGTTATMVIGFDETLGERLNHLERLRVFQESVGGALPSFLCWTYKPWNTDLGGQETTAREYLRWLALARVYLDNFDHIRTSVLTRNEQALQGLRFGADDFDLPTEDEVTQKAGATISIEFERILDAARGAGYTPNYRQPFPVPPAPRPPPPSSAPFDSSPSLPSWPLRWVVTSTSGRW